MGEQNESVILDVKLDAAKVSQDLNEMVTRIAALKTQQRELTKEINAGRDADGKYAEQLIRVKDQLSWTEKQAKGLSATTKLLTADTQTYSDSLNGQRQKLADMQKAYDQLDKAQRESEGGRQFLEAIKAQHDAVLGLEGATGRMQRNVGNYPKALTSAIPGFDKFNGMLEKIGLTFSDLGTSAGGALKKVGSSMANLGKQAASALANPIILAVAAVVVVLKQLYDAFQRNEQAQNAWQKATAPFMALWQNFQRVFDDIVKSLQRVGAAFGADGQIIEFFTKNVLREFNIIIGVVRVAILNLTKEAEIIGKVFTAVFGRFRELTKDSFLSRWFESARAAISGFIDQINAVVETITSSKIGQALGLKEYLQDLKAIVGSSNELTEANKRIVESEAAVAKQRRENVKQDADDQRDIAELRAKAAERDKYTAAERLKFLEDANAKEEAIAKRAFDLAKTQYESEKLRNSLTESNAEDLERENQAYANMVATETAYLNKQRELAGQMSKLRQQNASERKAEQDKATKEAEAAERARMENAKKIAQEAEDFALSLIEDETEKAIAQRRIQGEREIAELQRRLNEEKNLTAESRAQLAELILGKQEALYADLERIAAEAAERMTAEQEAEEQARAARILEYRLQLTEQGSVAELELMQSQLDLQMEQALAAENLTEEEKYLIRETFAKKAADLDTQYHNNLIKTAENAREQYRKSLLDTAANASSVFGSMSDLLAEYGEQNEDAAAASRAFGVASIVTDQAISIANTAKAITEAVAGATQAAAAGGPAAPFLLAGYVAAMVGAVLGAVAGVTSSIQQAKSLMSQADGDGKSAGKYAGGGVVPGTSYTGDKLTANVNSAEVISNPRQAANLLYEISNNPARGGFDYGQMAEAIAAANESLPAPVMNYEEFADFNKKRLTYNEFAKI